MRPQTPESSSKDKSGEAPGGSAGNAVNAGDVLLANPNESLNAIRSGTKSTQEEYNHLIDAMHLARLASTPENSKAIAVVDLEFGKYYLGLSQLDALGATKAKAHIEEAIEIYEHNHDRDGQLTALKEELALVQKTDPHPDPKPNEKTEAQRLQDRITQLTQFDSDVREYETATGRDGNETAIATSLEHLSKDYAKQGNLEQSDSCLQTALSLKSEPPAKDNETRLLRNFKLACEMFGNSSELTADAASELGDFYKGKGPEFEDIARSYYSQALAVYDRSERPLSPEISVLKNYAELLQSQAPETAQQLSEKGQALVNLAAYSQSLRENITESISPFELCSLAKSYDKLGDTSKADALFTEAVRMHQNLPDDSNSTYSLYADFLQAHGRTQEAIYFRGLYNLGN